MYIWERGRLGDNQSPKRITLSMRPKPHFNLDRFPFNKASFTNRLKGMVNTLGDAVIRSLSSSKPIEVIRLIGHTDSKAQRSTTLISARGALRRWKLL